MKIKRERGELLQVIKTVFCQQTEKQVNGTEQTEMGSYSPVSCAMIEAALQMKVDMPRNGAETTDYLYV